ncbi:hypothetical protein B0T26DRAFT_755639 [Lasiosphaeria miniovina]|uniref:Uncharacterized protein n=1 Tax=Lasiosphaeria miniovina TaxID=1954250 RepID=A0AA39ZYV1_9PEZI|nr:uncharacterized protein B0T26DRAFT_755639 [Lasiosphaeria miniovina]KAK0706110.1 hypothetical protein B0T26DRAFT_755639 [Lasiosphaeria miniovina]
MSEMEGTSAALALTLHKAKDGQGVKVDVTLKAQDVAPLARVDGVAERMAASSSQTRGTGRGAFKPAQVALKCTQKRRISDLERGRSDGEDTGGSGGVDGRDKKTGEVKKEGSAVIGRTWLDALVECVRSGKAVVDGFWWVEVALAMAIVVVLTRN